MTGEHQILLTNVSACEQRIQKLSYSIGKSQPLFPLTKERIGRITDEQEESIDALTGW